VFLSLFENENSFKYIPSQRKYQCILEGAIGGERLKNIFKYGKAMPFRLPTDLEINQNYLI
jgi:hypothetical protein